MEEDLENDNSLEAKIERTVKRYSKHLQQEIVKKVDSLQDDTLALIHRLNTA